MNYIAWLIPASAYARSIGGICCLAARSMAERAPRMYWIDERRSENDRLHLIHAIVVLYGRSRLVASRDASLL